MAEGTDKVLSKSDKSKSMSDPSFASVLMREAFPRERHGSVYSAQYAAFDYLRGVVRKNMTLRRARAIWEGSAKRIDAEEAEALKRAKFEEREREIIELRRRLSELDAEFAGMDKAGIGLPRPSSRRPSDVSVSGKPD